MASLMKYTKNLKENQRQSHSNSSKNLNKREHFLIYSNLALPSYQSPLVAQLVKNPPAMQKTWVRSLGSIPGLERSPGEGNGYTLQYSGLENSMDCIVHGVAKSRTQLSNFHFISLGLS